MKATRALLIAAGAGIVGYGGWLLWPHLPNAWTWLLAGPILHDVVIAPTVALLGFAATRAIPNRTRRRWLLGALTVTGVLLLIATPLIWRPAPAPPNPGLQDRDYVTGLAIWLAALWTGATLAALVHRYRGHSGNHPVRSIAGRKRLTGSVISRLLRKPITWLGILALAAGGAFGLYWFQPWKLVTDKQVSEALTVVSTPPPSTRPPSTPPAQQAAGPTLVGQGEFISHEHDTTGTARIIRTPDGSHRLELADLATSNGPDLRVWLTDQPVKEGLAGWRVFDDGSWVELGRLKGNRGDQTYQIPAGTDLEALTSVSIWCKRFSVSFGAANLTPAP